MDNSVHLVFFSAIPVARALYQKHFGIYLEKILNFKIHENEMPYIRLIK